MTGIYFGRPVSAPKEDVNEFAFKNNKFTIELKAMVTGISTASQETRNSIRFAVDEIGETVPTWGPNNPGSQPTINGDLCSATVVYTGLPADNSSFGTHQAIIKKNDLAMAMADFEVFFETEGIDHAGPPSDDPFGSLMPNWYYYWKQELQGSFDLEYGGGSIDGLQAQVKGMREWNYANAPNKTKITIYNGLLREGKGYDTGDYTSGIDYFVHGIFHESQHVTQIEKADAILKAKSQITGPWQFGWSFNQPHNHWYIADKKPGSPNYDDDGDGMNDNLKSDGPGELGKSAPGKIVDDVKLEHAIWWDWPAAWPLPVPNGAPHPIESDAVNYADQQHSEHDYARKDWGNPGKNHQTLDNWND